MEAGTTFAKDTADCSRREGGGRNLAINVYFMHRSLPSSILEQPRRAIEFAGICNLDPPPSKGEGEVSVGTFIETRERTPLEGGSARVDVASKLLRSGRR